MNAPELKPCPFCGGKPYLANVEMVGCSYVVCTDCRMQSDDMSKDRAVDQWNRRADPLSDPRVVALVEALEYTVSPHDWESAAMFHARLLAFNTAALAAMKGQPE